MSFAGLIFRGPAVLLGFGIGFENRAKKGKYRPVSISNPPAWDIHLRHLPTRSAETHGLSLADFAPGRRDEEMARKRHRRSEQERARYDEKAE